jgi:hypothetical protein
VTPVTVIRSLNTGIGIVATVIRSLNRHSGQSLDMSYSEQAQLAKFEQAQLAQSEQPQLTQHDSTAALIRLPTQWGRQLGWFSAQRACAEGSFEAFRSLDVLR